MSHSATPFTMGKTIVHLGLLFSLIRGSPERLSPRYEQNEAERKASGFANSTYKTVFDRFDQEGSEV